MVLDFKVMKIICREISNLFFVVWSKYVAKHTKKVDNL